MTSMEAFPRRASALLIGGLMALATLAGCGSGAPAATPTTSSMPQLAPDPAERCGFQGTVTKLELTAADGVKLAGARIGSGPHGVVLVHQAGSDMCGWNNVVPALVEAGFQVVAIDLRCNGYSECDHPDEDDWQSGRHDFAADAAAAVKELKRSGATKVVVMGASLGAATAVVTAGRFADQVSGVIGLSVFSSGFNASGDATTDIHNAEEAAPRITTPVLIAGSTGDPGSIRSTSAEALINEGPMKAAGKVVFRDGSAHGWDMLNTPDVLAEVLAFLKAHA